MLKSWTQTDALKLRQFLIGNPNFLDRLMSARPKVEGSTMESRAVSGSDLNGFLSCIDEIARMQEDRLDGNEEPSFTE